MPIRQARRGNAKPLIGLHSESGCGKTMSALLLARGFVGPQGRICMIETEAGRGEAYADPQEYPEIGGYDVFTLTGEFPSKAYGAAIAEIEKAGYDALIIDSASHEWDGIGGVLDWADRNDKAGKRGPLVWQEPKISHKREFVLRFTQTSIPLVILCMRSRYPMIETKDRDGKKVWARSEHLDPIQSDDILYEMFLHGWIGQDHGFRMTKCTSRELEKVFVDGKPISVETGQQLKAWCEQTGRPVAGPQPPAGEQEQAKAPEPTPEAKSAAPDEAGGEDGPNVGQLVDNAMHAAQKGTAELQAFWKRMGKVNQKVLKPYMDGPEGIKAVAERVDAAAAVRAGE